jgi:arylsulfatase A-like enzyme
LVTREVQGRILGAGLAGLGWGFAEFSATLLSPVWVERPLGLALLSLALGLLFALPGALLGRGAREALALSLLGMLALEMALAVATDPPPFQDPAWYVGNPLALMVGLAAIVGAGLLVRRVGPAWALSLLVLGLPFGGLRALEGVDELDPAGPSVLLVTLDTTRADHIGAYGHAAARTPHMDALAARGIRFDQAYAQIAVTGPSHTTMMTGTGTWTHATLLNGVPVPEDRAVLAEELRGLGWQTGAFVSAYVLDGDKGFERGFEVYDDDFSSLRSEGLLGLRLRAAAVRRFRPDLVLERRGDRTVDAALDWLEGRDGGFLLWVHLFDPHGPYVPPAPYDEFYRGDPRDPAHTSMSQVDPEEVAPYLRESLAGVTDVDWVLAQYDGEIAFADAQLGRLLEAIPEDTVVVVVGDHGEAFGEHGVWFDHGDDLYDASTRVPFILAGPGIDPAVRQDLVELTDLAPTLYGLLGVEPPEGMDGRDLLRGGRSSARGLAYDRPANLEARAEDPSLRPSFRVVSLRSSDSRYVHREAPGHPDTLFLSPEGEGYRPHDEVDVAPHHDLGVLQRQAQGLLSGDAQRSMVELSEDERLRLEALGYME